MSSAAVRAGTGSTVPDQSFAANASAAVATPDAPIEAQIAGFTRDVQAALGDRLRSLTLYGSTAGEDWIANRSDLNVAIVVARVTPDVLEALVPVVARWRGKRFALPLIVDHESPGAAGGAFPVGLAALPRPPRA